MKQKLIQTLGVCVLLCFSIIAMAQTRTVSGTVLDDKDAALSGAVVKEKGTKNGAITDENGSFTITTTTENPVLIVSYFGMEDQEVAVGESNSVTVKLMPSSEQMGRVVVTASTQAKSTRTLGYSVTSVSDVELTEGGDRSVLNSMQGKVAGVTINQASSDPGASSRVIIRGIQSLTQGNQPLIVVDGVPLINNSISTNDLDPNSTVYNTLSAPFDFGNGLNAINPEDIESIDVLKGASATALYGSRAANGVIMITTKKGSAGQGNNGIGIMYSGNVMFNSVLRMPTFQNQFGQGWDGNHWLDENGSWGPEFDERDRVFGRVVDNSQLLKPFVPLENNVRDFFERGVATKNHVALMGATATGSFYASFSNVNQDGIYPGNIDVYNRNTISLRAMQDFGLVRVTGSMNYAKTTNSFVPTGQGQQGVYNNLMQLPRDLSVLDMQDYEAKFYNYEQYFTQYGVTNPYFILNENGNGYEGNKFFGGLESYIDLPDNFGFTYRFGYDIENHFVHTHRAILLPKGVNAGSIDDPGFVSEQSIQRLQLNHDFLITYNKELNSFLNFDILGGFNINSRGFNSLVMAVNGLDIPGFYNVSNSPCHSNCSGN